MASVLESIVFEPAKFEQKLQAFEELLKSKADLSERKDIQPFFKKSKHLTASRAPPPSPCANQPDSAVRTCGQVAT